MSDGILRLAGTDEGKGVLDGGKEGVLDYLAKLRKLSAQALPMQRQMVRESWAACERPDVIVYHPKAAGAPHFAQKLGVPAVLVLLQPMYVPTVDFPNPLAPSLPFRSGWYNKMTYGMFTALIPFGTSGFTRGWREEAGLAPEPTSSSVLTQPDGSELLVLHAHSPIVIATPADWPSWATALGYWPLRAQPGWRPSQPLADFLAAGEPPVYVGFGSMAGKDPAALTQLVVAALAAAGARGVVATGWGGLRRAGHVPDTVLMLDSAPHEWLFPRMAAVVHHGGAGTTAAGLRAGRPAVVCPFGMDQVFWAWRVHELGVGSEPIPQARLTVARLAAAITLVTRCLLYTSPSPRD